MKTIASLEVGQMGEILDRLRDRAIPFEMRTVRQESGLEMSEVLVEDSDFDRGCDVVEAWQEDQLANQKKQGSVYCRKCGSRNYDRTWDENVGFVCKCKDCGYEFGIYT
jgi:Zn finger protein HypA/HybF involved in hydrogenase expression